MFSPQWKKSNTGDSMSSHGWGVGIILIVSQLTPINSAESIQLPENVGRDQKKQTLDDREQHCVNFLFFEFQTDGRPQSGKLKLRKSNLSWFCYEDAQDECVHWKRVRMSDTWMDPARDGLEGLPHKHPDFKKYLFIYLVLCCGTQA